MLPRYRRSKLIQIGINYWYFFASLFQVGWTITFSFELIPISLVMMLFILASLIGLLISEGTVKHRENSWQEYWFLEFPFEVLTGWIIAAFVVNINVLVVHLNASESIQLVTGIISLVSLFIVGIVMTCFPKEPTFVIPIVMAWATVRIHLDIIIIVCRIRNQLLLDFLILLRILTWNLFRNCYVHILTSLVTTNYSPSKAGINAELRSPADSICDSFSKNTIDGIKTAAMAASIIILLQIAVRISYHFTAHRRRN